MRGYFIHLLSLQTSFAKDKTLQYLTKQLKSGCLPFTWTTRFGRMVSKISSGNHVYHICKSVSVIVKRPRRLETGIKDGYVWNSPSGNTGLPFLIFRCFWKFSAGTTQKVVLNLLSNRTFWNYL